ncbi:hypothetical protein GWI33_012413, partial [Rhynchophorus ferrugineus]
NRDYSAGTTNARSFTESESHSVARTEFGSPDFSSRVESALARFLVRNFGTFINTFPKTLSTLSTLRIGSALGPGGVDAGAIGGGGRVRYEGALDGTNLRVDKIRDLPVAMADFARANVAPYHSTLLIRALATHEKS